MCHVLSMLVAFCVCCGQLWLGGTPNQTSLAQLFLEKVKVQDLESTLEPLFAMWKAQRQPQESFGAFSTRVVRLSLFLSISPPFSMRVVCPSIAPPFSMGVAPLSLSSPPLPVARPPHSCSLL